MRKKLRLGVVVILSVLLLLIVSAWVWIDLLLPRLAWISFIGGERTIRTSTLPLSLKWTWNSADSIFKPPRVNGQIALVQTGADLVALDSLSGQELWRVPTGCSLPLLLASKKDVVVFASAGCSELMAVSAKEGRTLWRFTPTLSGASHLRSIWISGDKLIVATTPSPTEIKAYRLLDGTPLWKSDATLPGSGLGLIIPSDRELDIFIGAEIDILDTETGTLREQLKQPAGILRLSGDRGFFSYEGGVQAVDWRTDQEIWRFDLSCARIQRSFPIFSLSDSRAYAEACQKLYALDPETGQLLWQRGSNSRPVADVVTIGDTGYVMSGDGSIIAFEVDSGKDEGILQTTPAILGPGSGDKGLSTDGNRLFATFGDNKIYAFGK
ncbi:MAG: PQQ-binding-like beta-propeller repeat protein [Anaerolineae bacterium]